MITSATLYWLLNSINITINVRNVCVLVAPFFGANTTLAAYFFTSEVKDEAAGLFAAALISIVPGYISRSVAGSYDYECVAICAIIITFYFFVKSVNTGNSFSLIKKGSFTYAILSCLSYFYMVNAWGGYIFIINIIPVYVIVLIFIGRYSHRLYVAYSVFYTLGTLLAMQVRFVGFQAVSSSEHMMAMIVFAILQIFNFINWVRSIIDDKDFNKLFKFIITFTGVTLLIGLFVASFTGCKKIKLKK
jgi:dolichyl-diphosphooligosaccharide---protein glycosyltransferase